MSPAPAQPGASAAAAETEIRSTAVVARIGALLHSLGPAESQVAQAILANAVRIPDMSAQAVAEASGTSRATVVRACQTFGYSGYQQLRILMARDSTADRGPGRGPSLPGSPLETMRELAAELAGAADLLDAEQLARTIDDLADARRILVVAGGLSGPAGADAAARLRRLGAAVMHPSDPLEAEICASGLGPGDVCLAISASGANSESVRVAACAARKGARVIALVTALETGLAEISDRVHALAVPPRPLVDQMSLPGRLALHLLVEALTTALAVSLGENGLSARIRTLEAASDHAHE